MAIFLYRDGANYKFEFTAKAPEGLIEGDETTIEQLGYTIDQFFDEVVSYKRDEEIDHNIVELTGFTMEDLPENYWDIIELNLPNYYSSDDVLQHDILTKHLTGEEMSETDENWIADNFDTKEKAQATLDEMSIELYTEAIKCKREAEFNYPNQ